jgi:hypothetical protein
MMPRFLPLLLALTCAGCATQASRSAGSNYMEPRVLLWDEVISERYDFQALTDFVNRTIREPHDWQGLDLRAHEARQWGFSPRACLLVSNNWSFGSADPKLNQFTLVTSFPESASKFKAVTLHCVRLTDDTFELERLEIESRDL